MRWLSLYILLNWVDQSAFLNKERLKLPRYVTGPSAACPFWQVSVKYLDHIFAINGFRSMVNLNFYTNEIASFFSMHDTKMLQ